MVAAIDMPLHGVTDTTNPFYQAANERTFNVDLVNNVTGAAPADGKIDARARTGSTCASSLTSRDNWRQGAADLIVFSKTVAKLDLNNDAAADVDPTRISYVGISLGGIMGGSFLAFAPNVRTATLSVPGGVISQACCSTRQPSRRRSSPASVRRAWWQNSTIFNNYFRDFQTMLDSGDPYSRILASQSHRAGAHAESGGRHGRAEQRDGPAHRCGEPQEDQHAGPDRGRQGHRRLCDDDGRFARFAVRPDGERRPRRSRCRPRR